MNKNYKKKLIIGIDPGTSCGLAVIDFYANLILLDSKKNIKKNDIVKKISDLGNPEIIASDVDPIPQFVKKIATKFNASIFTPKVTMSGNKKRELVKKYLSNQDIHLKNPHMIDALSAALKAHNYYKNKFEQIDAIGNNSEIDLNELKSSFIKGITIKEAIKSFYKKKKKKVLRIANYENSNKNDTNKKIIKLLKKANKLNLDNEVLKLEVNNLRSEIQFLKELLKKYNEEFDIEARKDRIIQLQKREMESLGLQLKKLKNNIDSKENKKNSETIRDLKSKGEMIILKPIKKFEFNHVKDAVRNSIVTSGDIPILIDSSGGGRSTAQILIKANIRAIIACNPMSHEAEEEFFKNDIPILRQEKFKVKWAGRTPYIKAKEINEIILEIKSRSQKMKNMLKESFILKSNEL